MQRQVARLPAQVRQRGAEIHRVLAGSAADFQHAAAVAEHLAQHGEDGLAVLLAGFGAGFVHQSATPGFLQVQAYSSPSRGAALHEKLATPASPQMLRHCASLSWQKAV